MVDDTVFKQSIDIADSIEKEPSTIGKKLIEIADNLHSLAKVENDNDIEFCSIILKRCGVDINVSRYSLLTEVMGMKLKEITQDDVKAIVPNLKDLIENLKESKSRNYNKVFELIRNIYFECGKVPTI